MTEAAALEGTPHSLLPATAAAHANLQPMDVPVTPHAMITTGTVTSHHALGIPPTDTTQPLYRLKPLPLQQLSPCNTRFSAQEDKATSMTLNPS